MKRLVRLLALAIPGCCALRAPAQDRDVSATIAPVAPRVLELVVRDGRVEYGERKQLGPGEVVYWFPMMCEYTVHTTIARNAYVWGYLALRG
jgi:hypothetical protein